MDANSDISSIKGIGPKTAQTLNGSGIFTIMDILLYFPRDYEIIDKNMDLINIYNGDRLVFDCFVYKIERDVRTYNGKTITTIIFRKNKILIKGQWFNQPYVKNSFIIAKKYILYGLLQISSKDIIIINPEILSEDMNNNFTKESYIIIPKYSAKGQLKSSLISKLVKKIIESINISENLPDWIIKKYNLCSLDTAIRNIHCPHNKREIEEALNRLKFQELFTYSLKILMLKEYKNVNKDGFSFKIAPELNELKAAIPFTLTDAQNKVIREVLLDGKNTIPMNRLVQGDVGSGKTIIAIISMFNVVKNGYQAALMAPTELLAEQHFTETKKLLKDFNIKIELLSGSITDKSKKILKERLQKGDIDIIIGTHALIQDDVSFCNLGMMVTDEQHRFGVAQRSKLLNKGKNIDVLVMTATPIPRTLTLYLYGDLDVSVIDELPPGRKVIETHYIDKLLEDKAYNFAAKEVKDGKQVYIVCPLIEDDENSEMDSVKKLYLELKPKFFKDIEIEMLHGKMKPREKSKVMSDFKDGIIKILISTTVIEVGVNVPNASLMIIVNAERFGLAQLHQLRGRVGRGENKSYCILITNIKNETIKKRMELMKTSNDGFFIAEEDLKLRGSGEMFGLKQHGEDGLILSNVIDDISLLKKANIDAKILLCSKSDKDILVRIEILKNLETSSKFICFN